MSLNDLEVLKLIAIEYNDLVTWSTEILSATAAGQTFHFNQSWLRINLVGNKKHQGGKGWWIGGNVLHAVSKCQVRIICIKGASVDQGLIAEKTCFHFGAGIARFDHHFWWRVDANGWLLNFQFPSCFTNKGHSEEKSCLVFFQFLRFS